MMRFLLCLCTAAVVAPLAQADDEDIKTIYPAPLPSPALKNKLLPPLPTQTAGDALPLYFEAIDKYQAVSKELLQTRPDNPFGKWTTTPLDELPRDEVRKALEPFKEVLALLDQAARRE